MENDIDIFYWVREYGKLVRINPWGQRKGICDSL